MSDMSDMSDTSRFRVSCLSLRPRQNLSCRHSFIVDFGCVRCALRLKRPAGSDPQLLKDRAPDAATAACHTRSVQPAGRLRWKSALGWLRSKLRTSDGGLLALSLVVGAGAGGGAVAFRWLIKIFTEVFSGYPDYAGLGRVPNPHVPWLGFYFVLLAPVVAGLLYGPLVQKFAKEARGHGVPEVMYAVARRGGKIQPQVAVVKAIASALTIGGGGSVGREGPIVQIGSALGSTLGQLTQMSENRVRVLVACGSAGGIAATFNAPLAGVFFAMELILRNFTTQAFGMVVISSVTASVIGRAALGDEAFLNLPAFQVQHFSEYGLFILLGIIAAAVGVIFSRVLYFIEDLCDKLWRGPEWLRPAVGGLLLGGVLLALPEMYGVGYPVLTNGVEGRYAIGFLLILLVGKMIATSLTIGIGGSGGVFAPGLFIGAMLGAAFGDVAPSNCPGAGQFVRAVRPDRHGRGLCRRGPGTHHRRSDHVRIDRRVLDHLAVDGRDRHRHRDQSAVVQRHDLHPEAASSGRRSRRVDAGRRPAIGHRRRRDGPAWPNPDLRHHTVAGRRSGGHHQLRGATGARR